MTKTRSLLALVVATVASTVWCTVAGAQPIGPEAARQIGALLEEKAARSPAQRKIGSHLIYARKQRQGQPIATAVPSLRLRVRADAGNRVLVDIAATVSEPVLNEIVQLGGEVVSSFPRYHAIRAWLPLGATEELAALSQVASIRPAAPPVHHKADTSEGDVAHRANLARSLGVNGSGVKVGVLSDSVDQLADVQGLGDVGAVTVLPGQSGVPGTSDSLVHNAGEKPRQFNFSAAKS